MQPSDSVGRALAFRRWLADRRHELGERAEPGFRLAAEAALDWLAGVSAHERCLLEAAVAEVHPELLEGRWALLAQRCDKANAAANERAAWA
jgi:hypothetical protein